MNVLTCINKYSEAEIRMAIKKISGMSDEDISFYMETLKTIRNSRTEKGFMLFAYIPEGNDEQMDISLFNTIEVRERYHSIRFYDRIMDPLSLDRKQADAVLALAVDLPRSYSLFELAKEQVLGAEINRVSAYKYGELLMVANVIINLAVADNEFVETDIDAAVRQLNDILEEENVIDAMPSADFDIKSIEDSAEYEADCAENSRQMAAKVIAYYKAIGKTLEANSVTDNVMVDMAECRKEASSNEVQKM